MKKETKRKLIDVLDEIEPEDLEEAEAIVKRDRALRKKHSGNGW